MQKTSVVDMFKNMLISKKKAPVRKSTSALPVKKEEPKLKSVLQKKGKKQTANSKKVQFHGMPLLIAVKREKSSGSDNISPKEQRRSCVTMPPSRKLIQLPVTKKITR
jgi:hypothetical protein